MSRKTVISEETIAEIERGEGTIISMTPSTITGTPQQEEEAAKEYKPADLGTELNPYRIYSDKFFSPIRQQAMAEKRKAEAERPKTLDEILKAEFNDPNGFQMGPLMRKAIVGRMPKTIADLEAMPFDSTDMNPIIIERYGNRILVIVASFER